MQTFGATVQNRVLRHSNMKAYSIEHSAKITQQLEYKHLVTKTHVRVALALVDKHLVANMHLHT